MIEDKYLKWLYQEKEKWTNKFKKYNEISNDYPNKNLILSEIINNLSCINNCIDKYESIRCNENVFFSLEKSKYGIGYHYHYNVEITKEEYEELKDFMLYIFENLVVGKK